MLILVLAIIMTSRIRPRALDVSGFFRHIQNVVRDVQRELSQRDNGAGSLHNCLFRVEAAHTNLQRLSDSVDDDHLDTYRRLLSQLQVRRNTFI